MKRLLVIMAFLFLSGCGANEMDHSSMDHDNEIPQLINVEIIAPPSIQLNKKVKISAHVTQNEQPVTDADVVLFEIRSEDNAFHEEVDAIVKEDGMYEIEKAFSKEGNYEIIAHVTARDMHTMPSKNIIVSKQNR